MTTKPRAIVLSKPTNLIPIILSPSIIWAIWRNWKATKRQRNHITSRHSGQNARGRQRWFQRVRSLQGRHPARLLHKAVRWWNQLLLPGPQPDAAVERLQ